MEITFDHVDFAYESFRRNRKNRLPENEKAASAEPEFALHDICFTMNSTDCLAILGRSGAGKSTLMSLFTGLARPSRGRILIDGKDSFVDAELRGGLRRRIGLVFQFPESQLFETTVYNDVAYGPRNLGFAEERVRGKVEESLAAVGLPVREFGGVDPLRLSQGEKRRAAIAGILAMQPEMLIMDEPTSGLDAAGRALLMTILRDFRKSNIGLAIISHDTSLAVNFASRALILDDGELKYDGDLHALLLNASQVHQFGLEMPRALRLSKKLGQRGLSFVDGQISMDDE